MSHFTKEQRKKINKTALADKHNCSSAYIRLVLRGEREENTSSTAYGIRMPANNNFCFCSLDNSIVIGMYVGIDSFEHTFINNCFLDLCVIGVNFNAGNHSAHATKIIIARCKYNIQTNAGSYFTIDNVSFEDDYQKSIPTPSWNRTIFDVNELGSSNGIIRYHLVSSNYGVNYSAFLRSSNYTGLKCLKLNEFPANEIIPTKPLSGLMSYWDFNETTGTFSDKSGNTRTLSRNSATSGAGKLGNAMILSSASNAYAGLSGTGFTYANSLTIIGWFKINATENAYQVLIEKANGSAYEYNLYYAKSANNVAFVVYNGASVLASAAVPVIADGNWIFLCAEINNKTSISLSKNLGVKTTASVSGTFTPTNYDLRIGNNFSTGSSLDGAVDEVQNYDRLLTDGEKQWLYNNGAGQVLIP